MNNRLLVNNNFNLIGLRLKSHCASMASSPLFINEAESMVILDPMHQFGCCKASSFVAWARKSKSRSRKGPPEAVRIIFSTEFPSSPARHWKIAECSLSTGIIFTFFCKAIFVTRSPATTRVSLLARAISLPADSSKVGRSRNIQP